MKVTVTKDGKLTVIPPLRSHIGEDVEDAISKIKEYRKCVLISDCIGFNGYRNETFMRKGERIEFVCETDKANEVVDEIIAPSEADWRVMDIFVYTEDPLPKKKYH